MSRNGGAGQIPDDLAAFIAKAQTAIDKTDVEGFKALAEKPESLGWLGGPRGFRGGPSWKVYALQLPKPTEGHLAVFSDFHTCESIGDHIHTLVKSSEGWKLGPEIPERDTRGYRVRDHHLTVTYNLPNMACSVGDDVLIERTTASTGPCLLRLSADMKVEDSSMNGKSFPVNSVPGVIAFQPPASRTFTLHLAYHGTVNHPGSDYIKPTEAVLCSYWYPHIARLPAKHSVAATVPKEWIAVGEGELLKEFESDDRKTYSFRNEVSTCYFTLDAGPYIITSRMAGNRKLSVYELKKQEGRAEQTLNTMEKCLAYFEKSFGAYPYTHYEVVETVQPFGGALEAYSFSTYGQGMFGACVHEMAHTWWGGIVPCPYTKSMWNESFASYSDGLFHRQTDEKKPAHALTGQHQDPQRGRGAEFRYPVPMSEAYDTSSGPQGSVGYGKGSLVLAMLEDLLGTETMIKSMRRFREDHRAGEEADWPEFQRAVNKTTGKNYGWFFDEWVNRKGAPILKLSGVTTKQEGGKTVISGEIVQSGEPYRLFIPLQASLESGGPVRTTVEVKGVSTPFRVTVSATPKELALDPEGTLLIAGAAVEGGDPFMVKFGQQRTAAAKRSSRR